MCGGRDDVSRDKEVVDAERLGALRKLGKPEKLEARLEVRRKAKEKEKGREREKGKDKEREPSAGASMRENLPRRTQPRLAHHPYKSARKSPPAQPQAGTSKSKQATQTPPPVAAAAVPQEHKELRAFLSKVKPGLSLAAYLPVFVQRGFGSVAKLQQLNEWNAEDATGILDKCFGARSAWRWQRKDNGAGKMGEKEKEGGEEGKGMDDWELLALQQAISKLGKAA
ncbi:hypothetical protein MKEN_00187400 [Mycena kentingensis (nom. inval.)]|nr:hypothetical protein MKEN_00187400 [Mycena kentingensis (nom. inval.)]